MASSSTPPRCTYHVFLSFRGEDTRKAFTDHLYTALLGSGFRTFRDNDGIERGENVKSELDNAIRESRSSIIVFSKDYASSRWCLDELVMILEHKRTSGHVILPVFYDVDPSQVRKQMGKRFMGETNERKKEYLRKKVEGWRAALREVADLAGMVLQNQADGHEAKFIQKIVKVIGDKLNRTVLNVAPYLIGIGSRVKNISLWLQDESTDVGIAVIYGMGGIGKTTIAKFVYNLNFERFEASSFLANVREISERSNGLIRLQRQLLSDILKRKKEKISSVDEGIIKIKDAIGCKRVLVVLDDVDQRDQFDAIIGMRNWFHPGSKIILTTRHKQLLKANEVDMMHKVERFDDDESLELFSEDTRKAFTDHLYTALLGSGFRTFRDNDGIGRGENVKSELDNAIRESSSSIIVFSKDYASSRWCLDELVMILEHKRTSGHVILPVFYDVDPSQVRKQMGNFAEAFGRHEERFMRETNERKKEYLRKKVEEWRAALRKVADLAGMSKTLVRGYRMNQLMLA
ncbi:hypothetical protein CsSME_00025081 [Camellia sinensis var. sinensis]